jgi:hypothetical protein
MVFIDLSLFNVIFPFSLSICCGRSNCRNGVPKIRSVLNNELFIAKFTLDHISSASQKYQLFADCTEQLQQRGMLRRNALMLAVNQ